MISTSSKKFKEIIGKDCDVVATFARENDQFLSKSAWSDIERKCNKSKNQILGKSTVDCPDMPFMLKDVTYLLATGKTFESKDTLKAAGGSWIPDLGGWVYPVTSCKELQGKIDIKDVKISPRAAVAFVNTDDVKRQIRASFDPRFHAALNDFMKMEQSGLPPIDAGKIAKRYRDKIVAIAGMDATDADLVDMISGDTVKRGMFWMDIGNSSVPSIIHADPAKAMEMLSNKTAFLTGCSSFPSSKGDPENQKCTIIKAIIETT
jgi:hypothetical protein